LKLSLVIPCYDEQEALPETAHRLRLLLSDLITRNKIDPSSNIWLVDDGSQDTTWSIIGELTESCALFRGVKLSRNHGHQHALLAGLCNADGDAVISLDADLQDDLGVIEQMIDSYTNGFEIVYAVRNNRVTDSRFKRWTAERYYGLLRTVGVTIVPNHADYRLMGRAALTALAEYQEVNLFLRGIIPQLGFRSTCVYYERQRRIAGESKYPLRKMLALAIDGVTSFSPVPLRMIATLGAAIFILSMGIACWVLAVRLATNRAVPGWASITLPIYGLGGLQLLSMGVVGEYIAKIYMETKRRPRFLVEKILGQTADRTRDGYLLRSSTEQDATVRQIRAIASGAQTETVA
jgi:glycosyltransferase involved in cell wall biosynthesis